MHNIWPESERLSATAGGYCQGQEVLNLIELLISRQNVTKHFYTASDEKSSLSAEDNPVIIG